MAVKKIVFTYRNIGGLDWLEIIHIPDNPDFAEEFSKIPSSCYEILEKTWCCFAEFGAEAENVVKKHFPNRTIVVQERRKNNQMKVNYNKEIVHNALTRNYLGVLMEQDYTPVFFSETVKINGTEKVEAGTYCYAGRVDDLDIEEADEKGCVAFKIKLFFFYPRLVCAYDNIPDNTLFDSVTVDCTADEQGRLRVCGNKNMLFPANEKIKAEMLEYKSVLQAFREKERSHDNIIDLFGRIVLSLAAIFLICGIICLVCGCGAIGIALMIAAVVIPTIFSVLFEKEYEEIKAGKAEGEKVKEMFDELCKKESESVRAYREADMCAKAGSRVILAPTETKDD